MSTALERLTRLCAASKGRSGTNNLVRSSDLALALAVIEAATPFCTTMSANFDFNELAELQAAYKALTEDFT